MRPIFLLLVLFSAVIAPSSSAAALCNEPTGDCVEIYRNPGQSCLRVKVESGPGWTNFFVCRDDIKLE